MGEARLRTFSGNGLLEWELFDRIQKGTQGLWASHHKYSPFQDGPTKELQTITRKRSVW
jgi:hypothetical protein